MKNNVKEELKQTNYTAIFFQNSKINSYFVNIKSHIKMIRT